MSKSRSVYDAFNVPSGPRADGSRSNSIRVTHTLYPEDLDVIKKARIRYGLKSDSAAIRMIIASFD